ncbi:DNA-deoxyinosine glycosylase [Intestinibacter bartlettii]|uniref:DNA-deoxyinosine glycosylase n=1 Tax=Intestinibacter bartlettii TaxID=261299 RepID=A0ABS6DYR3_9FIRM|nr:DNA-deoxyinosine glycosylase [Intestinibacter bartlettii]MBU5336376.1 DNA-deoxyinosine glycosylase [Intestinibacter bartlettii]MDO5010279.1 DNA-deoxyinosine glycosylase [Intestinibacter bartlettii]
MENVKHEIPPIYDKNSKILVLGSFPSVKSRENQFFYHHPQNRFWKVLSSVVGVDTPISIEEKKKFLLDNNIALWDVIASCDIEGSSDSSIKNVVANDLNKIIDKCNIKQIFCNGGKSYELYKKYCEKNTNLKAIKLPSTSPANARFSLKKLIEEWQVIKKYLF